MFFWTQNRTHRSRILYGKRNLVKQTPFLGGGEMIKEVSFEKKPMLNCLTNLKQELLTSLTE
jgi:hypothetical protein